MQKVLITGGTGLIGTALTKLLMEKNYEVIILTRDKKRSGKDHLSYAHWDVKKQTIDAKAIKSADHIIHLAGAGIAAKRWSKSRKKEIRESRVNSSSLLIKALRENNHHIKTVISASAVGWYGRDPAVPNPKPFREEDPYSHDFLGETCRDWEKSIEPVQQMGIRLVKVRTGIVLSNKGGALREFMRPVKMGVASILGSGKQMISWIHIDDICRIYAYALENESLQGPYNAVSPEPVTNKRLMTDLGQKMKGKFFIPIHVPEWTLKLVLGEMAIEVLKSTTVSGEKIRQAGFTFIHPSLESALSNLLKK